MMPVLASEQEPLAVLIHNLQVGYTSMLTHPLLTAQLEKLTSPRYANLVERVRSMRGKEVVMGEDNRMIVQDPPG